MRVLLANNHEELLNAIHLFENESHINDSHNDTYIYVHYYLPGTVEVEVKRRRNVRKVEKILVQVLGIILVFLQFLCNYSCTLKKNSE